VGAGWEGDGSSGAGGYDEYFGPGTDVEAVVYLMIMNQMLHDLFPKIITVGEDVSGMPTFSRSPLPPPAPRTSLHTPDVHPN
jgi:hypothetical protein